MNHRYRRRGGSGEPIAVTADEGGVPVVFRWRGRRYLVVEVVAEWVEALPWWVGRGYGGRHVQRHAWRVEAAPRTGIPGVYDLYRVTCDGSSQWGLERVLD